MQGLAVDYLRYGAPELPTAETLGRMSTRLSALLQLIGVHRPDLRRGEELFPEYDGYDLRDLRHATHDKLTAALRIAQRKLEDGTKFAKLCRWRAASLLYVVAGQTCLPGTKYLTAGGCWCAGRMPWNCW